MGRNLARSRYRERLLHGGLALAAHGSVAVAACVGRRLHAVKLQRLSRSTNPAPHALLRLDAIKLQRLAGSTNPAPHTCSAGTTVGAGILALPAVTQEAGFGATSVTLAGCGVFAMITGLLLAEVNMAVMKQYGNENVTFTSMAERTFGPAGGVTATALYIFHNYALLVACKAVVCGRAVKATHHTQHGCGRTQRPAPPVPAPASTPA